MAKCHQVSFKECHQSYLSCCLAEVATALFKQRQPITSQEPMSLLLHQSTLVQVSRVKDWKYDFLTAVCILVKTFCVDRTVPLCYLHYSPSDMDFRGSDLALDASLIHNLRLIASSLKTKSYHLYFSPNILGLRQSALHTTLVLSSGVIIILQSNLLPWDTLWKVPSSENWLRKASFHHPVHNKHIRKKGRNKNHMRNTDVVGKSCLFLTRWWNWSRPSHLLWSTVLINTNKATGKGRD